jgi:hypothetical protein
MTRYLSNDEYRRAKSALTRATNRLKKTETADAARSVIELVTRQFDEWDRTGTAYPDAWSRWERARDDAEWQLRRLEWGKGY